MKKLLLLILAVMFAAVALPACSDDDEGDNSPAQSGNSGSYASLIVGKWEMIHYSGEDGDYDVDPDRLVWDITTFTASGVYVSKGKYSSDGGTYLIEGNTITYISEGEYGETYYGVNIIKTLTTTTLVLENLSGDVFTYKRI